MPIIVETGGRLEDNGRIATLLNLANAPRLEKVVQIRVGLDPKAVPLLAERLGLSQERVFEMLGLKRATVRRKVAQDEPLNSAESERVLGLVAMLGMAERFRPYTRDPEQFDAATWLAGWLEETNPALGGQRPGDLLDTVEGQGLVRQILEQLWSGAYA